MRVLFTTPILEHPAAGGPQLRIENSILALNKVSELFVVSRAEKNKVGGEEAEEYFRRNCCELTYAPSVKSLSINRFVRKIQSYFKQKFVVNDADFILSYADQHQIDVIWFGYGNISYELIKAIKTKRADIKVVCDTDSVWSRFVLRGRQYATDEAEHRRIATEGKVKEEEERWGTCLADVTTAVSEVDAEYYRGLTNNPGKVHLFSNVINHDTYKQAQPPQGFIVPCIYLAGTFWPNSPMEDSARWMLEKVMPILKREIPGIHFYIAGRGSAQVLSDIKDSAVTVTGRLPSVLPYLTNTTVSIVPLRFESGTRFKILEAGACEVPVVSTTLGAEGIPITNGRDILIADTPEDFAKAIVRVIRDRKLAESLGLHLKELIIREYSIEALVREGQLILNYLGAQR